MNKKTEMTDGLAKTIAFVFAFLATEFVVVCGLFVLPDLIGKPLPVGNALLWLLFLSVINTFASYKISRVVGWG